MYEFLHQSRKETVVFKGDEDTFASLFDKFVSFASAKHIFEIGQQTSSYWYEEGEKDPNAMEEQGRQVEVGHGQACHLLGLREHLSDESRLFPQQRLEQSVKEKSSKASKDGRGGHFAEDDTTSKGNKSGEKGNAQGKRKNKSMLSVEGVSMGIRFRQLGGTTTDSSKPAIFGTLDITAVLGNTERPFYHYSTMARPGSSSITIWEQLRQHYRGKLAVPSVAKGVRTHRCERPGHALHKSSQASEFGNRRNVEGHVREVHTPLALTSEISRHHDAFIFEEFGGLIPRHSRVSGGLRREYHRLW